jgi:hypothetical protein
LVSDYRQFLVEREAHTEHATLAKILPFVVWVDPVPTQSDFFPCVGPVYIVHSESVSQLYRKVGRPTHGPGGEEMTPKGVCACMGSMVPE